MTELHKDECSDMNWTNPIGPPAWGLLLPLYNYHILNQPSRVSYPGAKSIYLVQYMNLARITSRFLTFSLRERKLHGSHLNNF
jgi:hypothetical protein